MSERKKVKVETASTHKQSIHLPTRRRQPVAVTAESVRRAARDCVCVCVSLCVCESDRGREKDRAERHGGGKREKGRTDRTLSIFLFRFGLWRERPSPSSIERLSCLSQPCESWSRLSSVPQSPRQIPPLLLFPPISLLMFPSLPASRFLNQTHAGEQKLAIADRGK